MSKIIFLGALILLFVPLMSANSFTDNDADCEQIITQLNAAKSQAKDDYNAQKKAYETWSKYYKELHSMTYEATDEPLADSVEKCKTDEYQGKDFCKGAIEKFNEISAKEQPEKAELEKAKAKLDESRQNYNSLVRQASEMGCDPKKN